MLKRNKKNVLIGVCALAGVALTSVGFATWIVGVQRDNMDVKINTEIDSVQSDTKYLTVDATDAKVQIGESTTIEKKAVTDIVGVGTSGSVALYESPLKFTFKSINLKLGVGVAKPSKLKFELNSELAANAINKVSDDKVKLTTAKRGDTNADGSRNYLSYSEEVTLVYENTGINMTKDDKNSKEGIYDTYNFDIASLKGQMSWGSFFNNSKPSEFYNNVYKGKNPEFDILLDASAKANEEISTMYKAFNGSALTISVTLID